MPEEGPREVFISHTHVDAAVADALDAALRKLFGRGVVVHFSSSKGRGGVPTGTAWFHWIIDRVEHADVAFVLLTPASLQKPWVLWEAGAVYGTALSRGDAAPPVLPLRFRIPDEALPEPFRQVQVERGDHVADVAKVFEALARRWERRRVTARAIDEVAEAFVERVDAALATAPMVPTEATVEEWCRRLDALSAQGRASEVGDLHQWLEVAFGRDGPPRPLDLRLHRRLGELYFADRDYPRAIEQFELCRAIAPRDLFVLRKLGQACLEQDSVATATILEEIAALDPRAFERSAECAALKGRWLIAQHRLADAREVYNQALAYNPRSHHLAGRLAQIKLALGDPDARHAYDRVTEIIRRSGEQNLWTHADEALVAIACDRRDEAMGHLRAVAALKPTAPEVDSIRRGLGELFAVLGRDGAEFYAVLD